MHFYILVVVFADYHGSFDFVMPFYGKTSDEMANIASNDNCCFERAFWKFGNWTHIRLCFHIIDTVCLIT